MGFGIITHGRFRRIVASDRFPVASGCARKRVEPQYIFTGHRGFRLTSASSLFLRSGGGPRKNGAARLGALSIDEANLN
jgi:hypothetical protein